MTSRRALLAAALGFLQLRREPTAMATLRRYLDSWRGLADVVGSTRRAMIWNSDSSRLAGEGTSTR